MIHIRNVLSALVVFSAMTFAYTYSVSPMFDNHSFFPLPVNFSASRFLFAAAVFTIFVTSLNLRKHNIIDFVTFIAVAFYLLPVAVLVGSDTHRRFEWLLISVMAIWITYLLPKLRFQSKLRIPLPSAHTRKVAMALSALTLIVFIGRTFVSGSLQVINFDFGAIYDFRREQAEIIGDGIFAYLSVWIPRIVVPLFLIMALIRRRYVLVSILIAIQVYFFAITSARQILFIPILTALVFLFFTSKYSYRSLFIWLAVIVSVISIISAQFSELNDLSSLTLRRAFFVPAAASFVWYDFFSINSFVMWSDRIFSSLFDTQYNDARLPFMIGFDIRPDREWSANAGLVATGYANLGVLGVIIYAVILSIVIRIFASLNRLGVPLWLTAGLIANPIRTTWADADLLTALLTHGLIVVSVLLYLTGRTKEKN